MQTSLRPGTFHCRVLREFAAGGLGIVDEVEVTETNCEYPVGMRLARKRLNDKWKNHPDEQQRFEREIQTIQGMDHLSIVSYRGENLPDSIERYYFMPVYEQNLRQYMAGRPAAIKVAEVSAFGAQLADALGYAHGKGHIHRDLKPENVLLAPNPNGTKYPVIADWGLGGFVHQKSKVLQNLTRGGGMGTEYYCSLEQWTTGKCDERGDVYSLGVTLGELAHGRQPPMKHAGAGVAQDVVVPALPFLPLPPAALQFNQLIRRMTTMLADGRPSTMAEVKAALLRVKSIA